MHHTLSADCATTFLEWIEAQAMAQIIVGGDYAYLAGYQNAFKTILGLLHDKD